MSILKPFIQEQTTAIQHQVKELHQKIEALQVKSIAISDDATSVSANEDEKSEEAQWSVVASRHRKPEKNFPDLLRQSVRSALEEEQTKHDVIIARAEETGDDFFHQQTVHNHDQCKAEPS